MCQEGTKAGKISQPGIHLIPDQYAMFVHIGYIVNSVGDKSLGFKLWSFNFDDRTHRLLQKSAYA